ncbi:MAG: histidine phosphatase family protein [Clostridia bacterium]|nr:histidine phosphatase family protein [Clostridia bacterium]
MRIIFVRHGKPDYAHDCLTDEGRRQASAAAERLSGEGISEIYASPQGRAAETASYTAARLGLPVTTLDFMHEISWGGDGIPENGHPWTLGRRMIEEDFDFRANDWMKHPYFSGNTATGDFLSVAARFDGFLSGQGYVHDGTRFLCTAENDKTIALFSHGGSGACALAHILSLPFPYVSSVLSFGFTSVTILSFPVKTGSWVHPHLELFNDCAHIRRGDAGPEFQQTPDRA